VVSGEGRPPLGLVRAALHVYGLWGFWVAQPLYDLIGQNPTFLIAQGADTATVLGFIAFLSVIAPTGLVLLIVVASRFGVTAGRGAYAVVLTSLFGVMTLNGLQGADWLAGGARLAVALGMGALGATAALRLDGFARLLSVLSLAAVFFPLLFVVRSSIFDSAEGATLPVSPEVASDTPVVLVVLDELPLASLLRPDGTVDADRFPHFAAFASVSSWFPEATAVSSDTSLAVPAILTGRYPREALPPGWRHQPENLFTLLREGGPIVAFEEITRLCPPSVCGTVRGHLSGASRLRSLVLDSAVIFAHLVVPWDWRSSLPAIEGSWSGFLGGTVVGGPPDGEEQYSGRWSGFGGMLTALRETPDARLYFLHLLAPHAPWEVLPSGKEYGPVDMFPPGFEADAVSADGWAATHGWQRHLAQLVFVDQLVGELLDTLRDVGLYDRALIVLVSDHGASFWPGSRRRYLSGDNASDLLSVPLFVKWPGQRRGDVRADLVETVDIVPTVADVLRAPLPWSVDGRSLASSPLPARAYKRAYQGRLYQFDPVALSAARQETVARSAATFGPGVDGLFEMGPYPEWLGEPARATDPGGGASEPEVSLQRPGRFARVDRSGTRLPALVAGTLSGGTSSTIGLPLAIGLNGRIVATTRTGASGFRALVPESSFLDGANVVDVFRVRSDPPGLVALARRDRPVSLVEREGTVWIRDGVREVPVREGVVAGTAVFEGGGLTGVAALAAERRPVESILLFRDGVMLFRTRPGGMPDLIDEVEGASFRFTLPGGLSAGGPDGRGGLRLFGVTEKVAGELHIQYPAPRQGR